MMASPSHSNRVSDGVYICSKSPTYGRQMPYLSKDSRPDFNDGLGGDLNSGRVLAPAFI